MISSVGFIPFLRQHNSNVWLGVASLDLLDAHKFAVRDPSRVDHILAKLNSLKLAQNVRI